MAWPLVVIRCPKASPRSSWPVRPRARSTGNARAECPSCGRQLALATPGGAIALVGATGGHRLASAQIAV